MLTCGRFIHRGQNEDDDGTASLAGCQEGDRGKRESVLPRREPTAAACELQVQRVLAAVVRWDVHGIQASKQQEGRPARNSWIGATQWRASAGPPPAQSKLGCEGLLQPIQASPMHGCMAKRVVFARLYQGTLVHPSKSWPTDINHSKHSIKTISSISRSLLLACRNSTNCIGLIVMKRWMVEATSHPRTQQQTSLPRKATPMLEF